MQTESELSLKRELVQEVQLTNTAQLSNRDRSIRNRNKYLSQISSKKKIVSIKTPQDPNFEEKLGKIKRVKPKLIRDVAQINQHDLDCCENQSKSRSRSRRRIVRNKPAKYDMVLRSRAKKSSENSSQRNSVQSSRSIKHSKPSSVTTLYTASSANASHGQVRVLTKYEDSQPYQNNNAKYLMRSREIIEEINESINSSVADDMSRLQCFQNNLQSSDLDMSLISEIRSELDQSCNMSIDEQKAPIER